MDAFHENSTPKVYTEGLLRRWPSFDSDRFVAYTTLQRRLVTTASIFYAYKRIVDLNCLKTKTVSTGPAGNTYEITKKKKPPFRAIRDPLVLPIEIVRGTEWRDGIPGECGSTLPVRELRQRRAPTTTAAM